MAHTRRAAGSGFPLPGAPPRLGIVARRHDRRHFRAASRTLGPGILRWKPGGGAGVSTVSVSAPRRARRHEEDVRAASRQSGSRSVSIRCAPGRAVPAECPPLRRLRFEIRATAFRCRKQRPTPRPGITGAATRCASADGRGVHPAGNHLRAHGRPWPQGHPPARPSVVASVLYSLLAAIRDHACPANHPM